MQRCLPWGGFWRDALRVSGLVQMRLMPVSVLFWFNGVDGCVRGHGGAWPSISLKYTGF